MEFSKEWSVSENEEIYHNEEKYYEIIKGVNGNPVINQILGGDIYLIVIDDKVLCEQETIFKNDLPTKEWRVIRNSFDNPNQAELIGDTIFLGEGHSNTQRITGATDKFWLINLTKNPDPSKYKLLTQEQLAKSKDNFGKAALFMKQFI